MINGNTPKAATFKLVLAELERYPGWRYICFVLDHLKLSGDISVTQRDACQECIERMLLPSTSYGNWLHRKHSRRVNKRNDTDYVIALREGRIQWVKHIIEVLEK